MLCQEVVQIFLAVEISVSMKGEIPNLEENITNSNVFKLNLTRDDPTGISVEH